MTLSASPCVSRPVLQRLAACEQKPFADDPFQTWKGSDGSDWLSFYRQPGGYVLRFPQRADFEVTDHGRCVKLSPVPHCSEAVLEHLYFNQVLPLCLAWMGQLVLHGSAVDLGGHAVAFLGSTGAGKSTLAASFAVRGHPFVTDDGLCLKPDPSGGGHCIENLHPSLRLWSDSLAAVLGEGVHLAPELDYTDKARIWADPRLPCQTAAVPLRAIFLLGDGAVSHPCIESLSRAQAMMGLIQNSFVLDTKADELLARHFDAMHGLSAQLSVYRLDYPRDYGALQAVQETVLECVRTQ